MQQMQIQGQIESVQDIPELSHGKYGKSLTLRSANTADPNAKEQTIDLRVFGDSFKDLQVGQNFELDVRFTDGPSSRR